MKPTAEEVISGIRTLAFQVLTPGDKKQCLQKQWADVGATLERKTSLPDECNTVLPFALYPSVPGISENVFILEK